VSQFAPGAVQPVIHTPPGTETAGESRPRNPAASRLQPPFQALPGGALLIQGKVRNYGRQTDRVYGRRTQQIEAIVIDKDKEEAIKFLAVLVQRFKGGSESHVCGPKRTQ